MNARISTQVAKEWFIHLGVIGLWYVGILIILSIGAELILRLGFIDPIDVNIGGLFGSFSQSTAIVMLVSGIVLPLIYQKYYISLGVTRTQMSQGMLLGVVAFSLVAALVHLCLNLVYVLLEGVTAAAGDFLLLTLSYVVMFVIFYSLGWLIAWGFTYGRFYTAGASIIIGIIAINVFNWTYGTRSLSITVENSPSLAGIGILVLIAMALLFVLFALIRRISIKVA